MKLTGKKALITGGNSGIGLATARLFIAEGAQVAITGRDQKTLDEAIAELGSRARGYRVDITVAEDRKRLFAALARDFGKLDIVFANAGISGRTPTGSTDEAIIENVILTNLNGAFFTVNSAAPLLNDNGSIIFTGSVHDYLGQPGVAAYAATKGGLVSMARSIAADLAPRNIRVNVVAPGATLLDGMTAESVPATLRSEIAALFPQLPPSQQAELLDYQWKKIDAPEMVPVLRQIYETAPQSRYPENPLFASAVERLYELDTNRTRTLLLEEMKRPDPRLPYRTLAMLPDANLPELDATLLDRLQHNGGRPTEELIARYSTKSILVPLKDFYAKRDAEMRSRVTTNPNIAAPACEPPLVAYFLRIDPAWGEKVLRQSLAERGYTMGRCWLGIIGQTAVFNSGPVWERVVIDALQDPAVPVKIDAVKSLAQYGSPAAKPAILEAFRYWHKWWENRGEQNDESRHLEQAFVEATMRPKNWTPTDADLADIRDLCLTAGCKSQVPQHQN